MIDARLIFKKGDKVVLSKTARKVFNVKYFDRRKLGIVVGFSSKYPWCVYIRWIEGHPSPIRNRELLFYRFLEKNEEKMH